MKTRKELNRKRIRRAHRTRAKIQGTKERPRLSVFRSNRYVSAQLIDDEAHKTILAVSGQELKKESSKKTKKDQAREIGKLLAKKALEKGIKKAVFDRRYHRYHGRVQAFAEGVREGGIAI